MTKQDATCKKTRPFCIMELQHLEFIKKIQNVDEFAGYWYNFTIFHKLPYLSVADETTVLFVRTREKERGATDELLCQST